jgi:hypothetical protein
MPTPTDPAFRDAVLGVFNLEPHHIPTLRSVLDVHEQCAQEEAREPVYSSVALTHLRGGFPRRMPLPLTVQQAMVKAVDMGVLVDLTIEVDGEPLQHRCRVGRELSDMDPAVFAIDPEIGTSGESLVRTAGSREGSLLPLVTACEPAPVAESGKVVHFRELGLNISLDRADEVGESEAVKEAISLFDRTGNRGPTPVGGADTDDLAAKLAKSKASLDNAIAEREQLRTAMGLDRLVLHESAVKIAEAWAKSLNEIGEMLDAAGIPKVGGTVRRVKALAADRARKAEQLAHAREEALRRSSALGEAQAKVTTQAGEIAQLQRQVDEGRALRDALAAGQPALKLPPLTAGRDFAVVQGPSGSGWCAASRVVPEHEPSEWSDIERRREAEAMTYGPEQPTIAEATVTAWSMALEVLQAELVAARAANAAVERERIEALAQTGRLASALVKAYGNNGDFDSAVDIAQGLLAAVAGLGGIEAVQALAGDPS